jgi:DNA-binding LacI/PurR family transcriptional regulator/DNA-binding transcriptional regulator YhcF (GntR family)
MEPVPDGMQRARAYLSAWIKANAPARGQKLPPVKLLAHGAKASFKTVCAVLHELQLQGTVTVIPKKGAFLGGPADVLSGNRSLCLRGPHAWERLKIRIENDILEGKYGHAQALPTPKELRYRYAVCHATLQKALHRLCEESVVTRHKRTYALPGRRAAGTTMSLLLIGVESRDGSIAVTRRNEPFFGAMENGCANRGVRIEKLACRNTPHGCRLIDSRGNYVPSTRMAASAAGSIIVAEGIADLHRVIANISRAKRPVAVLDEHGGAPFHAPDESGIRLFSVANSARCGLLAGKYLLDNGHHSVAYISPYHGNAWSVNRYKGLCDAFDGAGFPDGVHAFTLEEHPNFWTIPQPYREKAGREIPHLQDLEKALARSANAAGPQRPRIAKGIDNILLTVRQIQRHEMENRYVERLFDRASEDRGISAWAVCSDQLALFALDYLREKRIRVPRDLSVLGFDDTWEASYANLTSFSFNFAAVANAMIEHICNPVNAGMLRRQKTIEIDGIVVERATIARTKDG